MARQLVFDFESGADAEARQERNREIADRAAKRRELKRLERTRPPLDLATVPFDEDAPAN